MEGTRYNISDAVETFSELEAILNEVILEVGDKTTQIQRIVERVKTLMSTHYGQIIYILKEKLKEKVKALRTQLRKRMNVVQSRILEILESDPRDDDSIPKARILNTETVELQRLSLDETVLTLILRKDMSDDELTRDRELRVERNERANRTLERAIRWVEEIPTLEDGTVLELSLLASEDVPPTEEEYDNTIIRATIDQEEQEIVQQVYEQEDRPNSRARDVSPEPEKHPQDMTSTPKRSPFSTTEEVGGTKKKKQVSYDLPENLETIWTSGVQKGLSKNRIQADHRLAKLPSLMIGWKVIVQDPFSKEWNSKGVIKSICETKCLYTVNVNGSTYQRNRTSLRPGKADGSDHREINQEGNSSSYEPRRSKSLKRHQKNR